MQTKITNEQIHNEHGKQAVDLILPIQQIEFNVPVTLEAQPDLLNIDQFYYKDGGAFWGSFSQWRAGRHHRPSEYRA